MILGDRAAKLAALLGDVAEAGMTFAACPIVHVVEEFAALPGGAGRGNGAHSAAAFDDPREQPKSRSLKRVGDAGDKEGFAQMGFARAIFEHGFAIRNTREFTRRRDFAALGELLE